MSAGDKTDRDKARQYRDRAEECRTHAGGMLDPEARAGLLQIAQSYEAMAKRLEAKLAPKKSRHNQSEARPRIMSGSGIG